MCHSVKGLQMVKAQLLTHLPVGGGGLRNAQDESTFSSTTATRRAMMREQQTGVGEGEHTQAQHWGDEALGYTHRGSSLA